MTDKQTIHRKTEAKYRCCLLLLPFLFISSTVKYSMFTVILHDKISKGSDVAKYLSNRFAATLRLFSIYFNISSSKARNFLESVVFFTLIWMGQTTHNFFKWKPSKLLFG